MPDREQNTSALTDQVKPPFGCSAERWLGCKPRQVFGGVSPAVFSGLIPG